MKRLLALFLLLIFPANSLATSLKADEVIARDGITINGDRRTAWPAGGGSSLPVTDTTSIAEGSADATKEVRFEVDGITTGTVRVITMPDADVSLFKNNLAASSDPGSTDDSASGYAVGSIWINTSTDTVFQCADATASSAVWKDLSTDTGGSGDTHPIVDSTAIIKGSADATKLARFEVDGVSTATTRVITIPDQDIDLTPNSGTFSAAAHAARHTDGSDDIQNATAAQKGLATAAQITKLDGIEASADVTDTANVQAALPVSDTTSLVEDPVDGTKEMRVDVEAVATGTIRVLTMPDQNIDLTPGTGSFATEAEGALAATALQDLTDDGSPQLSANLDVNGNSIVSASAGDISITPDTTGDVILDGLKWPQADGASGQVLKTDGAGQTSWVTASGTGDFKADGTVAMTGDIDHGGNNIDEAGVVNLIEQAAADADAAGRGQLWVKTATPNQLMFTDDAGTDVQLGAGGGGAWTWVSTTTASASASLDFTGLTESAYMLVFKNILPATDDAYLWLRADSDGGASFSTSNYQNRSDGGEAGGTAAGVTDAGASAIFLTDDSAGKGIGSGGTSAQEYGLSGIVYVLNTATASTAIQVTGFTTWLDSAADFLRMEIGGTSSDDATTGSTENVDAIQLLMDSGNIASGTVELYKSATN